MKGARIKYIKLGELMREARQAAGYDLATAALMIGVTSSSYLAGCEVGRCNFPFSRIKRAAEFYGLEPAIIAGAMSEDYAVGILEALK